MSTIATARRADSRWWLGLLVYLLIGCYAVDRTAGPRPRWREAEDRVSAARARETLAVLLGEEEKPHPAGTVHNEHVRVRLLGLLDELKVQTWVMPVTEAVIEPMIEPILKRTGETREQIVARLQLTSPMANIVGRVAGERRGRPVILATHYDSAFNAPGAGDAGQCVAAILETVRALRSEPLKYEVWLLLTDAEEFGLWGAQALMKEKSFPWGDEVPIVINFDARGDRGAVLLYETHEDNLRAMQVAARGIASPGISTSLMVNVYQRLPNGTDFTVFRRAGWCGWNFAVVAGADRYHTPQDNLANLSPRSVQHFAAHAYGLLRRLDGLSLEQLQALDQSQPASFFDVLGWFLVVYPANWNYGHVGLLALLMLAAWWPARRQVRLARLAAVLGAVVVMFALAYGAGRSIHAGLRAADALPRNFVQYYELLMLLYVVAAAGLSFAVSHVVRSWAGRDEAILAVCLVMLILGFACCLVLPGGAYLLLWPATWDRCGMDHRPRWSSKWLDQRPWCRLLWCLGPRSCMHRPTFCLTASHGPQPR